MERARFALLAQILSAPFYTELRTRQQLGYVVFASGMSPMEVPGVNLVIQSPGTPAAELQSRIERFVDDHAAAIEGMSDEAFERHGVERRNRERTAAEHAVQSTRAQAPVRPTRVDHHRPMFDAPAPRLGSGFLGPEHAAGLLALWGLILRKRKRKRD